MKKPQLWNLTNHASLESAWVAFKFLQLKFRARYTEEDEPKLFILFTSRSPW